MFTLWEEKYEQAMEVSHFESTNEMYNQFYVIVVVCLRDAENKLNLVYTGFFSLSCTFEEMR